MVGSISTSTRPLIAVLNRKNKLVASALEAHESISTVEKLLTVVYSKNILDSQLLGKDIYVEYQAGFADSRSSAIEFAGNIVELAQLDYQESSQHYVYQVIAMPWFTLLKYRKNCRVFQNTNLKDIAQKLFNEAGFQGQYQFQLKAKPTKREYCIQFNESDFDFLTRLFSEEGVHYHFIVKDKKLTMVIGNDNQAFTKTKPSSIPFVRKTSKKQQAITLWQPTVKANSNKVSLLDYSYDLVEGLTSGTQPSAQKNLSQSLEHYSYPAAVNTKQESRDRAKLQMEALDAQIDHFHAESTISAIRAGMRFKLSEHADSKQNQEYLVLNTTQRITASEGTKTPEYSNSFNCMPSKANYRPPLIDKPTISSLQSATVTGPKNDELYMDKLARIKVQFHWDKEGKRDENTSCWLRVAQGLASKGFGIQFIPRIGNEVLVGFIDGDPDRPVVVSSVYNGENKPPYSSATQSGVKTRSTPKATPKNYNELRFEDKKDKEEVYLQAERNYSSLVKNDSEITIKGHEKTSTEKTAKWLVTDNIDIKTDASMATDAKKDISTHSGGSTYVKSDNNIEHTAKNDIKQKATNDVTIDATNITITGKSKIVLKVGSNKITLTNSGIEISGLKVDIKATSSASMKATTININGSASTTAKGGMVTINGTGITQVKAGGMVQIQGALTKIN